MSPSEDDSHHISKAAKIGLVGPCGAGKSTLAKLLRSIGYTQVRHIAQEHSFAPAMWQRLVNPDVLIFLEVSYENTCKRRNLNWTPREYQQQLHRLRHAYDHADLILDTNPLTPEEALAQILAYITSSNPENHSHTGEK